MSDVTANSIEMAGRPYCPPAAGTAISIAGIEQIPEEPKAVGPVVPTSARVTAAPPYLDL